MFASEKEITLSTFALSGQNRTSAADQQEDLNLQITLLIEQELTQSDAPLIRTASRLDLPTAADPKMKEVEKEVAPHVVSDTLAADPENR